MKDGFTLIEMLVAVTIILIMSLIALNGFTNQLVRTRDETRKANLEHIRSALEVYRAENISIGYPTSLSDLDPDYVEGSLPKDPSGFAYYYNRLSGSEYKLCAYLERGGSYDCGSNCDAPGNCNYQVVNP